MDACLLNDKIVFPWLRSGLLKALKNDLESKKRKETNPSSRIRTATNFFDPLSYKRKVRVDLGKSTCVANQISRANSLVASHDLSTFDLPMATLCVPEIDLTRLKEER